MAKNKNGFGFGKTETSNIYNIYLGKFIATSHNGHGASGILKKIDDINGVAYLQPGLVARADETLEINYELPILIPFPLGPVYPLSQSIEDYVVEYNHLKKRFISTFSYENEECKKRSRFRRILDSLKL